MNDQARDELMNMSRSDRWLMGVFLPCIFPVVGWTILLVQKESTATMVGWIIKWCVVEFLTVSFVFMVLLFLWAICQANWIAVPLVAFRRRLTLWLASLFVLTAVANAVIWLLGPLLGIR